MAERYVLSPNIRIPSERRELKERAAALASALANDLVTVAREPLVATKEGVDPPIVIQTVILASSTDPNARVVFSLRHDADLAAVDADLAAPGSAERTKEIALAILSRAGTSDGRRGEIGRRTTDLMLVSLHDAIASERWDRVVSTTINAADPWTQTSMEAHVESDGGWDHEDVPAPPTPDGYLPTVHRVWMDRSGGAGVASGRFHLPHVHSKDPADVVTIMRAAARIASAGPFPALRRRGQRRP